VTYLLLVVSFALLLGGALVFTNAIEWAGARLDLGGAAVGSVLAAIATALPESTVPIVAIITGDQSDRIAIGSIVGAPFLLGTVAMAVAGLAALGYRRRRAHGARLILDKRATARDLTVFLATFGLAVLLGVVGPRWTHIGAACLFVLVYIGYVWRTIRAGGGADQEDELGALYLDPRKSSPPSNLLVAAQTFGGLAMIVGGAELFVTEIEHLSTAFGISALVLALIIAPLATELPETSNSFIWIRKGKDTLALGNVTGAMVFQALLPVSVGLAFTPWDLSAAPLAAAVAALTGTVLAGVVLSVGDRLRWPFLAAWLGLYAAAIGFIATSA
jgi:cation:H+ antiporter